MRTRFLIFVLVLAIAVPNSALALNRRRFGASRTQARASTVGNFLGKQIWLPGAWTVQETNESLVFAKLSNNRTVTVTFSTMPREQCSYGLVRMRALKAWGGAALEQWQGRIENIVLGTLKYRGYSWIEPTTWAGDHFWCIAQDLKTAALIRAPEGDKELVTFVRNDVLLQIASRQGRSVLPWPMASEHSSSSQ